MFVEVCLDFETFLGIFDKMNNFLKKVWKALCSWVENVWADLDKRIVDIDE